MINYSVYFSASFVRILKKLVKGNQILRRKAKKTIKKLGDNPFDKGLKTHKVKTRQYGNVYSSKVTGDIRIIWIFVENKKAVILALTIGGHSGKHDVYR